MTGGDAVFVDTTYDLDRALRSYYQQLEVICRLQQTQAAALNQLQTEIGLRRAALNDECDNFFVHRA